MSIVARAGPMHRGTQREGIIDTVGIGKGLKCKSSGLFLALHLFSVFSLKIDDDSRLCAPLHEFHFIICPKTSNITLLLQTYTYVMLGQLTASTSSLVLAIAPDLSIAFGLFCFYACFTPSFLVAPTPFRVCSLQHTCSKTQH